MNDLESQHIPVNTTKPTIPEPQAPNTPQKDASVPGETYSLQVTQSAQEIASQITPEVLQPPGVEQQVDALIAIKAKLAELDSQRTEVDSPQNRKIRRLQEAYFREQLAVQPDDVLRKLAEENQTFRDLYVKEKGKEFSVDAQGNTVDSLVVINQQVALFKELLEASAQHMPDEERQRFLKTRLTPNVAAKRRTLMRQFAKENPTGAEALTEKSDYLQKIVAKTSGREVSAPETRQDVTTRSDADQMEPENQIEEVAPAWKSDETISTTVEPQVSQVTEREETEKMSSILSKVESRLDSSSRPRANKLILSRMLLGKELPDQKVQPEIPQVTPASVPNLEKNVPQVEDKVSLTHNVQQASAPEDVISVLGTPVPSAPVEEDDVLEQRGEQLVSGESPFPSQENEEQTAQPQEDKKQGFFSRFFGKGK